MLKNNIYQIIALFMVWVKGRRMNVVVKNICFFFCKTSPLKMYNKSI